MSVLTETEIVSEWNQFLSVATAWHPMVGTPLDFARAVEAAVLAKCVREPHTDRWHPKPVYEVWEGDASGKTVQILEEAGYAVIITHKRHTQPAGVTEREARKRERTAFRAGGDALITALEGSGGSILLDSMERMTFAKECNRLYPSEEMP